MWRLGLLIGIGLLGAGCTTAHKVVVQDGYQGVVTHVPPGAEPKRPGALAIAPEARADSGGRDATP